MASVSDTLLAPTAPPAVAVADNPTTPTVAVTYNLIEYKDAVTTLNGVAMTDSFVLLDTHPSQSSVSTLTPEQLSMVGLTETNILAFSANAVISAITNPESCGNMRKYMFELPDDSNGSYVIDDLLGEQIVFIAMIHHLFLLARIQNNSMPTLNEGYEACMIAMLEMLKTEKTATSIFGLGVKNIQSLYDELHKTYIGPIGSVDIQLEGDEDTSQIGVNSPRSKTLYDFLEMIQSEPSSIIEVFTNAITLAESSIPTSVHITNVPSGHEQSGVEHMNSSVNTRTNVSEAAHAQEKKDPNDDIMSTSSVLSSINTNDASDPKSKPESPLNPVKARSASEKELTSSRLASISENNGNSVDSQITTVRGGAYNKRHTWKRRSNRSRSTRKAVKKIK